MASDSDLDSTLRGQLIAAARAVAGARSWPWIEPVTIELDSISPERIWLVRTNCYSRGSNVRVRIRQSDQAILDAVFLPR
jgi:hypothetical protein